MQLEFLGTGTSYGVPQIGCTCQVCSSNDSRDQRTRCSIWVKDESLSIIVDTGPDFRFQCLRSGIRRIDGVLYTHFHADHVFGLDDIRQFNTLQKSKIPIYVPTLMVASFRKVFGYTIKDPEPGLNRPRLVLNVVDNRPIQFDNLRIQPVDVWHGKEKIKGYVFYYNNGIKVAYLVDCKSLPRETIAHVQGADVIILSALWKKSNSHPAHLNLEEAIELSKKLEGKATYLTHITHKMGPYETTQNLLPNSVFLAYDGLVLSPKN